MSFEIENIEKFILDEIGNKKLKRKDIAKSYSIAISYVYKGIKSIDFKPINLAIINRWSRSGLEYIKTEAWRILTNE
jgi:hypothetical protein